MSDLDRIEDFLAGRPAGIAFGPAERIQVRKLLLCLVAEGRWPDQPSGFKTLISPVVCTSREQQANFYLLFDDTFKRFPDAGSEPEESKKQAARVSEKEENKNRYRYAVAALVTLVLASAIEGYVLFRKTQHVPVAVEAPPTGRAPLAGSVPSQPVEKQPVQMQLKGTVLTGNRVAVGGADVWIPGRHTTTTEDGKFSFDNVPREKTVPVLAAQADFRAKVQNGETNGPIKVQLARMTEKQIPPVGSITPDGIELILRDHASTMAAFSANVDDFVLANDRDPGVLFEKTDFSGELTVLFEKANFSGKLLASPSHVALSSRGIVFKSNGLFLAAVEPRFGVEIRQADNWSPTSLPTETLPLIGSTAVAVSPDTRQLQIAVAGSDGGIWLTASLDHSNDPKIPEPIQALAFTPGGSALLIAGEKSFWRAFPARRTPVQLYPVEGSSRISQMQIDPSGYYLMLHHDDGSVDVWDPYGQRVKTPANWPTRAIGAGFSNGTLRIANRRNLLEAFPLLPWVVGAIPLAAAVLWLLRLRHKRARLRRKSLVREMSTHALRAPTTVSPFRGPPTARLGREMRRRKPGLTQQFSLEASIRATAMTAGFFTPIYTARKEQQEFLVLVERTGRGDQQEQYYRALVDALAPFSFIELYTFQGSPANVRDHIAEGWIGLRELAARYPAHTLWIIGDTADFIDPLTLVIPEWMREMQRWPSSSMLSPHAFIEVLHKLLRKEAIPAVPASIEGMLMLVDATEALAINAQKQAPVYPRILRRRPLQWVNDLSPEDSAIHSMLTIVEDYLGPDGMLLLRACAVYPEAFWKLTIWLAEKLLPEPASASERTDLLLRVTSLPWFRYGRIPDWARIPLIDSLGEDSTRVRAAVDQFLEGAQLGEMDLKLAHRDRGKSAELWDYIMFSFLLNEKLSVKAPSWWMRQLFHQGRKVFGARLWVVLTLASTVAACIGGGTYVLTSHMPALVIISNWKLPPPAPPSESRQFPSPLMHRAMIEVADSTVGSPAKSGWQTDVASQAALFALGRSSLETPISLSTPAPGLVTQMGVIESVHDNRAVIIGPQNGLVRRLETPLPSGPYLDYIGCVAGQNWVLEKSGAVSSAIPAISGTPDGSLLLAVSITENPAWQQTAGSILRSVDGGTRWNTVWRGDSGTGLSGILVSQDGTHVWAAGDSGILLSSVDSGMHWTRHTVRNVGNLNGIYGTATGDRIWIVGDRGVIEVSIDFGKTWKRIPISDNATLVSIAGTPDGRLLWAVGTQAAFFSKDFGLHWERRELPQSLQYQSVFVSSDGGLVIVGSDDKGMFRSTDQGSSWHSIRNPPGQENLGILGIGGTPDGALLWAFGENGLIMQSGNSGASWQSHAVPGVTNSLVRPFITQDLQSIWVGGTAGVLLKSYTSQGCGARPPS